MKYLMALALLALVLSLPGINFYHHIQLPTLISPYRIQTKLILTTKLPFFVSRQYDIRLENKIYSEDFYRDVLTVLDNAGSSDIIVFHLAGYGGDSDTLKLLVNGVRNTRAYVIMRVEAPVYSAHAYLASVGNKLIMSPFSSLMFHTSSVANLDCTQQQGVDRGVSNIIHCENMKHNELYLIQKILWAVPFLTTNEKMLVILGYDVYLTSDDMTKRGY